MLPSEPNPVTATQAGSGAMFDRIAARYDLLNRLMSFGIDQSWRRATVAALSPPAGMAGAEVLDLATGTGDLAFQIARTYPAARVTGLDPSVNMMRVAEDKLARAAYREQVAPRLSFVVGDAQQLPFADNTFKGVSMAFGIRNVPDRAAALREIARVTQTGGRIAILELSEPQQGLLAALSRFHMHRLVPAMGALLSGADEYRYLPQSIAAFPPATEFAELMGASGLRVLDVVKLTFGVCHLYIAEAV